LRIYGRPTRIWSSRAFVSFIRVKTRRRIL
jgi:hypothetical protein